MPRSALAVLLVVAAACSPVAASPEARTVRVAIRYSAFEPARIVVRPDETVRFVVSNADPIDHEFIVGDRSVQLAHERGTEAHHAPRPGEISVPAGETVTTSFTFGQRDLIFDCHLPGHYAYGMRGVLDVV